MSISFSPVLSTMNPELDFDFGLDFGLTDFFDCGSSSDSDPEDDEDDDDDDDDDDVESPLTPNRIVNAFFRDGFNADS